MNSLIISPKNRQKATTRKNYFLPLLDTISSFNRDNSIAFSIDTIRADFNKEHKLKRLKELGEWHKIKGNKSNILAKLEKRLNENELTSTYQLENYNIYYYNKRDKDYKIATLIIFGIRQYHKSPPPFKLIEQLINILKNVTQIDICYDTKIKPNIDNLARQYNIYQMHDTFYINQTNILMLDKITIYNKQLKNNLSYPLWRIEATINIPNYNYLALPLTEFKDIINIMQV